MGNATCGGKKQQLIFDAARDIVDNSDEWLGKGVLTSERNVHDGQLRLTVDPSDLPGTRLCKQVARTPRDDSPGSRPAPPGSSTTRSSGSQSRANLLEAASRALPYDLLEADPECRRFEACVSDRYEMVKEEQDASKLCALLSSCSNREQFTLVLRVEVASVTFKRTSSPFRHGIFVEENVRRTLEQHNGDWVMFASNYGNCVVEKVFCGGVLSLKFSKAGDSPLPTGAMSLQLGSTRFSVHVAQRGGDSILASTEKRKSIALDFVDKEVKLWCKSFNLEHLASKSRSPQVVRLKLTSFSRLEGLNVPGTLERMDFDRTAKCERARERLRRVERSRKLSELRVAVDEAVEAELEDPELTSLQELRRQLDAAQSCLQQALRQENIEALRAALARSEEVGLPEWERDEHETVVHLMMSLQEKKQKAKLRAAVEAVEIRVDDMVRILSEAYVAEYTQLDDFTSLQVKLADTITDLTRKAKDDNMTEDVSQGYEDVLRRLPEAAQLATANIAISRFAEAARELRQRCADRRSVGRRREEMSSVLRELVDRAETTEHGPDGPYEDLAQALREATVLIERTRDFEGDDDKDSASYEALVSLKQRGAAILEEKRAMDETAAFVEARLREACLADRSTPEALEAALQDVSIKHESGSLRRAVVSSSLVDSARRQLHTILRPEFDAHISSVRSPGSAASGSGEKALAAARTLLQRMELCRPACPEEFDEAAGQFHETRRAHEAELGQHTAKEDAIQKLRRCIGSGDPRCLEEALHRAKNCNVPEAQMLDAEQRLRELQIAERQLQSALENGDRVHLSKALEEAAKQQLKTPAVDEGQQRLQSSKTAKLVAAIRQRDYYALGHAINEAESRHADEVAEIQDVLEQAKDHHQELHGVAMAVSRALGTLSYDDLQNTVLQARRMNIITDDVKKAEGVLRAMDDAVEKLRTAAAKQPRDLSSLQEGLHCARQQGLQAHPVYRQAEEVFAGTCMPPNMVWALEEQRLMWVVLCLRRPLRHGEFERGESGRELRKMTHPFMVAVAELCHNAQISPEAEPYPVQFIHHALRRFIRSNVATAATNGAGTPKSKLPAELLEALQRALTDFSVDPCDGPPGTGEDIDVAIDAQQFNRVGAVAKQACLASTAHLLWWLVCIVDWETGQRQLVSFMSEMARRTADLMNEADSTGRSLRTHIMGLQVGATRAPEEGGTSVAGAPEVAPEAFGASASLAGLAGGSVEARITAIKAVLEEVDMVKREAERLSGTIDKSKSTPAAGTSPTSAVFGTGPPDLVRILESLQQASPKSLEEARAAVQSRQREASGRTREICLETYGKLEAKLLQLLYKGRQALDGEAPTVLSEPPTEGSPASPGSGDPTMGAPLPMMTLSPAVEVAASLQDHAFLQLLGVPEGAGPLRTGAVRGIDRCFQRVEIYDKFSEATGAVEDEFEKLCRSAVTEARQRCGGRRLIAALKPLLVDLVKRRQRISSMLNTLRNCGLDKVEKNLLRKHLQARDILIALTFSSMPLGPSQGRMMALAAKTDSPLPLLFGWARPTGMAPAAGASLASPRGPPSVGAGGDGLQLCTQIHWGALRELFCSPSCPLVLSLGTRATLGKSYLLQYLYALQECHFRGSTQTPLRIHAMPSVDIIGDFAREEALRGVTLADVHTYDPADELCEAMVATLSSCAELLLVHVSIRQDFLWSSAAKDDDSDDEQVVQASSELADLFEALALGLAASASPAPVAPSEGSGSPSSERTGSSLSAGGGGPPPKKAVASLSSPRSVTSGGSAKAPTPATVLLLVRDADPDDNGAPGESGRLRACVADIERRLSSRCSAPTPVPRVLTWLVPPLASLGQTEITNEVKTLRKNRAHPGVNVDPGERRQAPTMEEVLVDAATTGRRFPSLPVVRERYEAVAAALRTGRDAKPRVWPKQLLVGPLAGAPQGDAYGSLAQRIFSELGAMSEDSSLLPKLFPVAHCHQQLTTLSQQRQACLNRGREYLEPEDRRRLESSAEGLDREIARLKTVRQQAPPHALLKTFGQLVLTGDSERIIEFGAHLDDWKQRRRAPLLEHKLRLRKELDQLLEEAQEAGDEAAAAATAAAAPEKPSGGAAPRRPSGQSATAAAAVAAEAAERVAELRGELATLQRRIDQIDVSTDSFWLELMLWHEMERIGARRGLREIDDRLTFGNCKAAYLNWVKGGNPLHFLHSSPLQFGAFEPLRWQPQISGASLFGSDFIGDMLRELDRDLGVDVRRRPLLVISVIGVQSSGKSTLMNYLFGCSFATHTGRCTKGLYISLLETKRELIVILDTEGLLSVEARDDVFDKQVALMTMACSDLVIVNNRGELGRHVGDLFQVCLFALYHLKLARISPAIGFVLQCLSMVNQQQQYEWVATVKKSLEESVQELQQKERPQSFRLQDLVFLDSESIFVMPSAFNDDVQYGLQVSRPTNLYALKSLQLRERVFQWIGRAKASRKERQREIDSSLGRDSPQADGAAGVDESPSGAASFASLSQWYEHARSVWQTLSMCGTDLLQFRTMRQVLMAQQLQEFCDALVQKHIEQKMSTDSEALIERHTKDLRNAAAAGDVQVIDNAFRGKLDALRDSAVQEMQHEFDEFVKAHSTKFTDDQVKSDKRFSLMGPMRRKYASVDSLWRTSVHLALEQRSMDHLFDEISARVTDLLLEQGASVNVQNVERVFEEKWSQVMAEALQKQKPNLQRVVEEVVWHFNAALSNLKSQFRKAHIFHGVKALNVHEVGTDVEVCSSFLMCKKGVGDALVPPKVPGLAANAKTQVDNLWIKLVDSMRLEVDQRGQMSDATALKILNRLNSEMESGDQLRQIMHRVGSSFVHRVFVEIAKATMHYRFQIEQQNFQSRISEVLGKKQQKLWEIQARVDSGKREVHCAKVWAKTFVDTLDAHFKSAVGKMAQEIVSHMSNIMTNPANACDMAIERSFTKRNWRHVVMYAIDPTQYLFMEFHKEWEMFKAGLVDEYCQELKNSFGTCLRLAETRLRDLLESGDLEATQEMTMNRLSHKVQESCSSLADEALATVLRSCLPSFGPDSDWPLNNLTQFVQFAGVELQRYRANMRQTEQTVERRMEVEIARQKANCWKSICGCTARCPGCGTKCNLELENHWPERPHECRRHLYPAFNGWQKQEGRKPFLLHCRAKAQWQIARTRPPIEPGGPERYWDNFQEMLEDEHPDWLDPLTRRPLPTMEPLEDYEEDATTAPEEIQREIEENRRAWANCKDSLLEHFTSMADDPDIEWLERFKREGGALGAEDFASIRDELFAVTPLESLDIMDNAISMDDTLGDELR